jgi:DNA modification methylase
MRLADLKPAPYNPRTISKEAMDGLAVSLKEFGLLEDIVVNKRTGHIVGGHQRWRALQAEGETSAPVKVVDWDLAKEKRANLTLNNPYVAGAYTPELQELLVELQADPEFKPLRLHELLDDNKNGSETADLDVIPAAPAKPVSKVGDLWILGSHRLLCGDSTNPENIKRLFKEDRARCVFTDPPYGVSYEARSGKHEIIKNDDLRDDELVKLLLPALKNAVAFADDAAAFYIWHASSTRDDFSYAMKSAGLVEKQYLIWAKNGFSLGWSDYRWSHEPCFYASKMGSKPNFYGDMTDSTVWLVSNVKRGSIATTLGSGIVITDGNGNKIAISPNAPKTKKQRVARVSAGEKIWISANDRAGTVWEVARDTDTQHPTQKPAELAVRAIKNSTKEGEIVFDPFLGSGTTIIGAEHTGRRAFGCELDTKYADVIVKRWEKFTGQTARLDRD